LLAGLQSQPGLRNGRRRLSTAWVSGPPASLFMQTTGLVDGLDFLAALSSAEDQQRLQDAIIVHTLDAWRQLAPARGPLVLLAAPELELLASDVATAVNSGHHVFLSGPRGNGSYPLGFWPCLVSWLRVVLPNQI
jgi:hypothetical protein